MQRALVLDNAPPLRVPLPFFLCVPLFAAAACIVLLVTGEFALQSRWTPAALAMTHLFTLGVLGHAMCAGLFQILPVATGIHPVAPRITAHVVHVTLLAGTLSLVAGFLLPGYRSLFNVAAGLLAVAFLTLIAVVLTAMERRSAKPLRGATVVLATTRYALLALGVTVVFGVLLALRFGAGLTLSNDSVLLHGSWGLAGWVALLLAAMSFQLIPLFQATELYPEWLTGRLATGVTGLLAALTLLVALPDLHGPGALPALFLLSIPWLIFGTTTLHRLLTRKRPRPDPTTWFWCMAMSCLVAGIVLFWLHGLGQGDYSVALGALWLAGTGWSAITGMLYKIIPFLLWFNAQRHLPCAHPAVPKVRQLINERVACAHAALHGLGLLLLLGACLLSETLARPAALVLLGSAVWQATFMLNALALFAKARRALRAAGFRY